MYADDLDELLKAAKQVATPSISPEELRSLLAAAIQPPSNEKPIPSLQQDVRNFMTNFRIIEGPNAADLWAVYDFYVSKTKYPLTKRVFAKHLRKYLKTHNKGGIIFIKIDATAIGLPADYSIHKDPKFSRKLYANYKKVKT